MIGTVLRVARGEGLASVLTRGVERAGEDSQSRIRLARGAFASKPRPQLVNVLMTSPSPRLGGVAVQLNARLEEERRLREVALFHSGVLEIGSRAWRTQTPDARTLIVEGAFDDLAWLPDDVEVIFVIHDFTLMPRIELLQRASAAIFPSAFLRDTYQVNIDTHVIEPGVAGTAVRSAPIRNRIAFAGSMKPHKGGALIPDIVRATAGAEWHVFGGGDVELLIAARQRKSVAIHGYYRAGSLPRLLAREQIGLVVLPSIVPESFSLTLSECWSAGVPVVAFDHGAIAERIRAHGGGFLVPVDSGANGIAAAVREWLSGATVTMPRSVPTARDAAAAHVALYRRLGALPC